MSSPTKLLQHDDELVPEWLTQMQYDGTVKFLC